MIQISPFYSVLSPHPRATRATPQPTCDVEALPHRKSGLESTRFDMKRGSGRRCHVDLPVTYAHDDQSIFISILVRPNLAQSPVGAGVGSMATSPVVEEISVAISPARTHMHWSTVGSLWKQQCKSSAFAYGRLWRASSHSKPSSSGFLAVQSADDSLRPERLRKEGCWQGRHR